MVIKGTSCAGARRLAVHLARTDTNERAEVIELRGVAAATLRETLLEMEAVAAGTRCSKPFYHASINTRADERLTDKQRVHAIDRLEEALGLSGQARAVIVHHKEGREHCHIVWSRIDLDRMCAIRDSHNFRKHEEVSRSLEKEFGHERVQGAHIEREGKARPERTPSHAEMLQSGRTGLSTEQVKEQITGLWRSADSAEAFAMALWQAGYVLARGDRRDYVVIDPMGGTHSLARRIEGARAKDIRERMAGLDPGRMPNVADAKEIQRKRHERDSHLVKDAARDGAGEQRGEQVRREEEEKSQRTSQSDLDWTGKGGMVEQQRSAMDWVEKSARDKAARTEQTDRHREQNDSSEAREQKRKDLLRAFGRELDREIEDSQDIGRERGRSR